MATCKIIPAACAFLLLVSCNRNEAIVHVGEGDKTPPVISFAVAVDGFMHAVTGRDLVIEPNVLFGDGADAAYLWEPGASSGKTYTFNSAQTGDYVVTLKVTNRDGEAARSVTVRVGEVPTMTVAFAETTVRVPFGRSIILAPEISHASEDATFRWDVDGVGQSCHDKIFDFAGAQEGESYLVTITAADGGMEKTASVTVVCIAAEGTYRRQTTSQSSPRETHVFEFFPAPGQFINEGYAASSTAEACTRAKERLERNSYVSLGGFGGYITVGFDHSIAMNGGEYDFAILGNSHANSSEPGIVWVMQDENGNGEPDDTWYELRGSETDMVRNYAVTYYRPAAAGMKIQWTDNLGARGTIDRMSAHTSHAYFPAWITVPAYRLRGTRLKPLNSYDPETGEWVLSSYGWGYADNYEPDGRVDADKPAANYFSIRNAVRTDGSPANLGYIDFIRVQTGVNGKSGALGEISTEVCGFIDLNIN